MTAAHVRILGLVGLIAITSMPVFAQRIDATRLVRTLEIGDILGAEYRNRSNELLLYAEEPRPGAANTLHADDVVKMTLAVMAVGNFAFSLERGATHMEVWYLPDSARGRLTEIFHRSAVEETFYRTDRVLKDLANGTMADDSLRIGASALLRCSQQLCATAQVTALDFASTYVTYFGLDVGFISDGLRVWFDQPRLVVHAASRKEGEDPPACIREFATGLTANMDQLQRHARLGAEFRRLRNLLLLTKVLGWASSLYIPVRESHVGGHRTATVGESRPFRYTDRHIVCRDLQDSQRVRDMVLRGGIEVAPSLAASASGVQSSLIATIEAAQATAQASRAGGAPVTSAVRPMLAIRTVSENGRRMLEVSLSQILGLANGGRK